MDYRRPLFQLEQWSPFLARKLWGLTSLLEAPLHIALGLSMKVLTDINVEVEIPMTPLNGEIGFKGPQMRSSSLIAAGEFATRILWQRHLSPKFEEMNLKSVHCRFMRPAQSAVRARAELSETERERILRKVRGGESAEYDMPVLFVDNKDQQVANLNCVWHLQAQRPLALGMGTIESGS